MGSASQPMLVIKFNRALLKKRKLKDIRQLVLETSGKTKLEFKKVTPEELERIKTEIRAKAKKDAQNQTIIYLVCTAIVLGLFYWVFFV